jgi:hypothetical protein
VNERRIDAEVVMAEVRAAWFADGTIVQRLHESVVRPAQERGRTRIWLAGISLGGLAALSYAARHEAEVAGIVLISPYPATRDVLREMEAAGGAGHGSRSSRRKATSSARPGCGSRARSRAPAGALLFRIGRSLRAGPAAHGADALARARARDAGRPRLERMARALDGFPRHRIRRPCDEHARRRGHPDRALAAHAPGASSMGLHALAGASAFLGPEAWPWALGAVAANHLLLGAIGLWPRSTWLGANLTCLPEASRARREIALTFDDGPDPEVTPRVLDILDAHRRVRRSSASRATPRAIRSFAARSRAAATRWRTTRASIRMNFAMRGLGGMRARDRRGAIRPRRAHRPRAALLPSAGGAAQPAPRSRCCTTWACAS